MVDKGKASRYIGRPFYVTLSTRQLHFVEGVAEVEVASKVV
ncbi:hypothetical protein GGD38_006653 [Chitinophagaceae bacterium OAS944]|nr:hypothetical protein [Chitinophagaceae bacterium OAS944]